AGEVLQGDAETVQLLIANDVRRQSDPTALADYLKGTLALTMRRLEFTGEGTPEQRVDIVMRVLSALRGAPGTAELAGELLRYLHNQPPRQRKSGFYVTVANLGSIVSAAGDDRPEQEVFTYHLVLAGMRSVAAEDSLSELDGSSATAVSTSAFNVASTVSGLLRRQPTENSEQAVGVLRDLKTISAATARPIDVEAEQAAELVRALGFETDRPAAFLTVLLNMGVVAQAWQDAPIGLARLEASSGVVEAMVDPQDAASRLFNSGISLIRAGDGEQSAVVSSRLLLNSLGLRLALGLGSDLVVSLVEMGGLSCAVNLVGAFVDYQTNADPQVARTVEPLVRQLVNLTGLSQLYDTQRGAVGLARLAAAAERLGVTPEGPTSLPDLRSSVQDAVDSLRQARGGPPSADDLLLDTAQLIGHTFTAVLPRDEGSVGLQQTIEGLVTERDQPVAVLRNRYEKYAGSADDPVGTGPLVPAGVLDRSEWDRLARRLLIPIPTIVPTLESFPLLR
ncbi:MAG: hypothetical protein ACRDTT_01215, partial [Pseudonocardiaceae bacterium]